MDRYEYKVIPSPRRPRKAKGLKTNADRFANVLTEEINLQAAEGWEFVRAEALPMDEKPSLFKKAVETTQTVFVFRRALPDPDAPRMPTIVASRDPVRAPEQAVENKEKKEPASGPKADPQDPISSAVEAGKKTSYWD